MAYLTKNQLKAMGLKSLGENVKIIEKASINNVDQIVIVYISSIDDFCVISGNIKIGRNVHIVPYFLVAGGEQGITFEYFSGLTHQVKVFTQSDDYSGLTMANPTIPAEYKNEAKRTVLIRRHSVVGTGSIIIPGITSNDGTSVGAMSLVRKLTESCLIYLGNPAKKIKDRKKDPLELEKQYLESEQLNE